MVFIEMSWPTLSTDRLTTPQGPRHRASGANIAHRVLLRRDELQPASRDDHGDKVRL